VLFLDLAYEYRLLTTGGPDFLGANKREITLGTDRACNLRVPEDIWDRLHEA
jgi:hypothetical protein